MRKFEIALMLAKEFGYQSYLEIGTPFTGFTFSLVDKVQFPRMVRVMYRCAPDFSDGERVDFATEGDSPEELYGKLIKSGEKFDIVFIDAWHTYQSALRDITFGLHLIKDEGVLIIHDCNPPDSICAEPDFHFGEWCGVSYVAYLDMVLFTQRLHYVTVDSDYGCGIISKDHRLTSICKPAKATSLTSQWQKLDLCDKYPFFDENRTQLLHLVSPETFSRRLVGAHRFKSGRLGQLMRRVV